MQALLQVLYSNGPRTLQVNVITSVINFSKLHTPTLYSEMVFITINCVPPNAADIFVYIETILRSY